jgi:para-nitrobenzyl esterase
MASKALHDAALLRQTASGPVQGFRNTLPQRVETLYTGPSGNEAPLDVWLGVPYGQAERWQHVRPPAPWSEPRECFDYGAYRCP